MVLNCSFGPCQVMKLFFRPQRLGAGFPSTEWGVGGGGGGSASVGSFWFLKTAFSRILLGYVIHPNCS